MKKIRAGMLMLALVLTGVLSGQETEHRIKVAIGAFSPQLRLIKNAGGELLGDDFPNLNLSYEKKTPNKTIGYGAMAAFDMNTISYYEYLNASLSEDFFHVLVGGSVYFYPDEFITPTKLNFYARSSVGVELINKSVFSGYENIDEPTKTELLPFISIYAGGRYELTSWLEAQLEVGYRELAVMKIGLNIKI